MASRQWATGLATAIQYVQQLQLRQQHPLIFRLKFILNVFLDLRLVSKFVPELKEQKTPFCFPVQITLHHQPRFKGDGPADEGLVNNKAKNINHCVDRMSKGGLWATSAGHAWCTGPAVDVLEVHPEESELRT